MAAPWPMRPTLLAGAAAAATLGLSACARQTAEAPPAARDLAVAKVDDETIWLSQVRREAQAQGLIARGEALEVRSSAFAEVLQQVVDRKLLADEAVRRGLDKDPETERALAAARERVLGDRLVETVVASAIDEAAVQALYQEQLKAAGVAPRPLAEVRPQLVRFLTYDRIRDLVEQLRSGAKVETLVKPVPSTSTPAPEGRS